MGFSAKTALIIGIAFSTAAGTHEGLAQTQQHFPTKPIRLVVGLPAGAQPDILARMLGQKLSETWGRPVVVENRPGAGATLAAGMVAKATPDGYTLLFAAASFAVSAALQDNLPYNPLKDFAGISQIGINTQALVVTPALGAKSVKELIALAQSRPGKILFASSGAGTGTHLTGERFRLGAGINVVHVGFKGGPEVLIEVLGGRIHYGIVSVGPALPFLKDGRLLALAVFAPQRTPALPDVPTMAETLPGFGHEGAFGLLAPAGTPRPVINQISKEVVRILNLPEIRDRMQSLGVAPTPSTPEEHDRNLRAQIEMYSKLVRAVGLRN